MRPKANRTRSKGIALIAVLWLVAVLSLLAATSAVLSKSSRREAIGIADVERLDLLADSAIRLTLLKIIAAPRTRSESISLNSQLSIFDVSVSVTIELENGRIDLNTADDDLLFAFFVANGWTEPDAMTLVARIEDWKDADDVVRPSGAERQDYLIAVKGYGPRNGPI